MLFMLHIEVPKGGERCHRRSSPWSLPSCARSSRANVPRTSSKSSPASRPVAVGFPRAMGRGVGRGGAEHGTGEAEGLAAAA